MITGSTFSPAYNPIYEYTLMINDDYNYYEL